MTGDSIVNITCNYNLNITSFATSTGDVVTDASAGCRYRLGSFTQWMMRITLGSIFLL